jgi:hypothetical protein
MCHIKEQHQPRDASQLSFRCVMYCLPHPCPFSLSDTFALPPNTSGSLYRASQHLGLAAQLAHSWVSSLSNCKLKSRGPSSCVYRDCSHAVIAVCRVLRFEETLEPDAQQLHG